MVTQQKRKIQTAYLKQVARPHLKLGYQ
jgi:hypothetical protein